MRLKFAADTGGGNGSSSDWKESLPEYMRSWDEVKNSESKEKFYDQVKEMRSHLGSSIRIPSSEAGPEQWDAFNKKLIDKVPTLMQRPNTDTEEGLNAAYQMMGRPEKATDYITPQLEGFDMSAAEGFKNIAHKAGLNKKQFETIVTDFSKAQQAEAKKTFEAIDSEQKALKAEWGADYERRQDMSHKFLELTGAPENLRNLYKDNKVPQELSKWVYNMADKVMGESGINLATDANDKAKGIPTPNEAKSLISDIRNNKKHPYFDKSAPGHNEAVERMRELYRLAAAG